MENILKIKKVNIALFLFLILHQFLINAYALNYRKIDLVDSNSNNLENRNKIFKNLFAEKINDEDSISTKEIEEIEKFVEAKNEKQVNYLSREITSKLGLEIRKIVNKI